MFFQCFLFSCGHGTLYEALSVGLLVREHKLKSEGKLFVYVSELGGGVGWGVGCGWGYLPLPTSLQRYCDPALLVNLLPIFQADWFRAGPEPSNVVPQEHPRHVYCRLGTMKRDALMQFLSNQLN